MFYRQLFGTSQARFDLLNRFAGILFKYLKRIMEHEVALSLFRLLDPPDTCGKDNLSLERVVNVLKAHDATVGAALQNQLSTMRGILYHYADLRNKVIAHNDLVTTPAIYNGTSNILFPSRQEVESLLGEIRSFMNRVGEHCGRGTTHFEPPTIALGLDGDDLVANLEDLARLIDNGDLVGFPGRRTIRPTSP
jgi:hypothetical protein